MSKFKTYLTIVSIIIAILGGIYGLYSKVQSDKYLRERNDARDELTVKTTEVVRYKNKLGQEVTKTIEYKRTVSQLKNSTDSLEMLIYETIQSSNLKNKQIETATIIAATSTGSGKFYKTDTIFVQDTSIIIKQYNDGYLTATVSDKGLNYTYKDSLILLSGKRMEDRTFFLWKTIGWQKMTDKDMVEVVSTNPNSYNTTRMIRIKDNLKRPKINFGIGTSILITKGAPNIYGVGKMNIGNMDYLIFGGYQSYGIGGIYNF